MTVSQKFDCETPVNVKERIESVLKAEADAINSIEVTEDFVNAVDIMYR